MGLELGECNHDVERANEIASTSELDCFDVMAHIGYTRRYMTKAGFDVAVDLRHYGDEIETLLRILIINGKSIEINCSGLRNTLLNEPIPSISIIVLYRELGVNI